MQQSHYALENGHLHVAKRLLDAGANINMTAYGITELFDNLKYDPRVDLELPVMQFLLTAGVKPNFIGRTIFSEDSYLSISRRVEVFQLLLKWGADFCTENWIKNNEHYGSARRDMRNMFRIAFDYKNKNRQDDRFLTAYKIMICMPTCYSLDWRPWDGKILSDHEKKQLQQKAMELFLTEKGGG